MTLLQANGCWTWFNWPHAVYSGGSTYVGWVTTAGDIVVGRYNHVTGRWQTTQLKAAYEVDDHNNPALLMLDPAGPNGGKLLVGFSAHDSASLGNRTLVMDPHGGISNPPQSSDFLTVDADNRNTSYCHLFQMGNTAKTVYNIYRDSISGRQKQSFVTSTDGGASWSAETAMIDNPTNGYPYMQARQTGANRIDFIVTNGAPNIVSTNLYHFYMTVASDGTRSFFKSDGTSIGGDGALPIDPATTATLVWSGGGTDSCDPWDMELIGGVLTVLLSTYDESVSFQHHTYRRAQYTGGSWSVETITDGGTSLPNYLYNSGGSPPVGVSYSGGMALDPSDANTVYLSKKYGAGDWRMEKWVRGGGTWAKTVDVSGNTSSVNARPRRVLNAPTTQLIYWRGTYATFISFSTDLHSYPNLPITTGFTAQAKPAAAVWQTANAPRGVKGYWAITEGAGGTVHAWAPSGKDGTLVGAPSWGSGSYGPEMAGWSTADYVAIDPATQILRDGTWPFWWALMFKNSSTTAGLFPFSQGKTGDTSGDPLVYCDFNSGATGTLRGVVLGASGNGIASAASQPINDGAYHVAVFLETSDTRRYLYLDGVPIAVDTTAAGSVAGDDLLTLGVLRRGSIASPFGGTIVAFAAGKGDYPDPYDFTVDWLSGQFAAIRSPGTGVGGPLSRRSWSKRTAARRSLSTAHA